MILMIAVFIFVLFAADFVQVAINKEGSIFRMWGPKVEGAVVDSLGSRSVEAAVGFHEGETSS